MTFELPPALQYMAQFNQFILWKTEQRGDKVVKLPVDWRTLLTGDAHNPEIWLDAQTATGHARTLGAPYGVGFVFTEHDDLIFLDIDNCALPDGSGWSPLALQLLGMLPGAAVEVSQSGTGLHVFCRAATMPHRKKNTALNIELYSTKRFVALTGINALGDAGIDLTPHMQQIVHYYFNPASGEADLDAPLTDGPVGGYTGAADDTELIDKACASNTAANVFGGRASFADLWRANPDALALTYPPTGTGHSPYDESAADQALANHLSFWTGGDGERIKRLMMQSGLVRTKWDREKYIDDTIKNAYHGQTEFYSVVSTVVSDKLEAPELKGTKKQKPYAAGIREAALQQATDEQAAALTATTGPQIKAKFWIDNEGATLTELVQMAAPVTAAGVINRAVPEVVTGFQYLGATQQLEHFEGCVYVRDIHRVFTPDGSLYKPDSFNAAYGGYVFQLDESGQRDTRKAFEALTQSQIVRRPQAAGMCFRPDCETGALITQDGRTLVNTYVQVDVDSRPGDVAPFLTHLTHLLPDEGDRAIVLAYMAAVVQHKGVKFQWTVLLQGCEGNGKTLLTRVVAAAIGKRYTHFPKASDIDNKFNGWLLNKLFIAVEDIFVPDHKREVLETLKPMITGGDGLEIQLKGVDQITADICANFILNSNHKDAIRKTRNDRRFAVFYTAQQNAADLERDGLTGAYFPQLYNWLRLEGYAFVTHYLQHYAIPEALNPATACHRAPTTSSTAEAVEASLGGVEQEVLEAIQEGRPGFVAPWVSSVAVDKLLTERGLSRRVTRNKRRDLLQQLGYDYHPALLPEGRLNNPSAIDDGKKPRLFCIVGHLVSQLETAAAVAEHYDKTQAAGDSAAAEAIFGKGVT